MQYSQLGEHSSGEGSQKASSSSTRSLSSVSFGRVHNNPELKEPLTGANTNGSPEEDDPFYVFREDLYRKLDLVDESLGEYLRLVYQTDTTLNSNTVKDSKKQLKRHLRNAESTLKDVQTTVQLVENQREKFAHIDATELYERRALITTCQDRITRAKSELSSESVKSKLLKDERAKAMRRQAEQNPDIEEEDTAFIADRQAQTSLLMQHQDETLDELGDAVHRVGEMAGNIQEEIGFQNKMLEEMDEDLADAEEKLGLVMGKLAKFLKTKNKWQLGTILTLVLVVLILFFLVLYT